MTTLQPEFDLHHLGANLITKRDLVLQLLDGARHGRQLVALVGPPGVGKTTLAIYLESNLNNIEPNIAATLPLDGFHYDNQVLEQMGLLSRKGCPASFDTDGFHHILARLRYNQEDSVTMPLFDRALDISRAGARCIRKEVCLVLVEGNYLLLRSAPWREMISKYDLSVMLKAPRKILRQRLEQRWLDLGFDAATSSAKVDGNDIVNANLVLTQSVTARFVLDNS